MGSSFFVGSAFFMGVLRDGVKILVHHHRITCSATKSKYRGNLQGSEGSWGLRRRDVRGHSDVEGDSFWLGEKAKLSHAQEHSQCGQHAPRDRVSRHEGKVAAVLGIELTLAVR